MVKAIFLDRDGTINELNSQGFVHQPDNFRFLPGALEGLKEFSKMGYKLIIVTNQSGIGHGFYTEEDMHSVHEKMVQLLSEEGIEIHDINYCPHKRGEGCSCRKPRPGMIATAIEKHGIDISRSFMVGDNTKDIKVGENAGLKTIGLNTGYGLKDGNITVKPDFMASSLLEAAEIVRKVENGSS